MTAAVAQIDAAPMCADAPPPTRAQIFNLQAAMAPHACEAPQPGHMFAPGLYLRTLEVPAGMTIVGKTHMHAHFLFVLKGRAVVVSEFGRETLDAGYHSVSLPGVKRVVHALEDTLFATVHHNPSDTQDLTIIESQHIAIDLPELQAAELEALQ